MMLLMSIKTDVLESVNRGIYGVLILLDGIVYKLVSALFELFYTLAGAQLLDNRIYEAIAEKVYLFIGIIALFSVSITLLKTMTNPDDAGKSVIKSFKSLITSVLLVILMPTIFQYAYSLQGAILSDDIIGKIFRIDLTENGNRNDGYQSMYKLCDFSDGDKEIGINLGDNQNVDEEISISKIQCQSNYITMEVMEAFITPSSPDITNKYSTTWNDAREYMILTGSFNYVSSFVDQMLDGENGSTIDYSFLISTVAGCVLVYVILSFCIDLGVRSAKLAFYQLISPIPILMRMIPGKEGQFDKWSKSTISTFVEVFVRLIIINFIVFILSNLFEIIDSAVGFKNVGLLAKAVLALGLFMFGKQAPKLLSEALGFEAGNLKFGIKGKLTETPIVGKGFSKAYDTANKFKKSTQGAITGGLGAGWTAFMNGGNVSDAMKYGSITGLKRGGNQFNAQRQGAYSALGFKGDAGWFGNQTYLGKKADDIKDKYVDDYKDHTLRQWISRYESGEKWQKSYNDKLDELRASHMSILDTLQKQLSDNNMIMNNELEELNKSYENERQKLRMAEITETDDTRIEMIKKQLEQLNTEYDAQRKSVNDKYTALNSVIQGNINKEKDILEGKTKTRSIINEKGKVEQIAVNELEQEAFKHARKQLSDEDVTYSNRIKVYTSRINEKEVSEYTRSLEGQKQEAVMAAALKKAGVSEKELEKIVSKSNDKK